MGQLRPGWLQQHGFDKAEVLVETGSYNGKNTRRAAHLYREVHTIELDPVLHAEARRRLAHLPNVTCHRGDSAHVLSYIIDTTKSHTFWLDAHAIKYDGEPQPDACPVFAELRVILGLTWFSPYAVIIDDFEKFGRRFWRTKHAAGHDRRFWPRAEQVLELVRSYGVTSFTLRHSRGYVLAIRNTTGI